jgi:hypothetical protein
LRQMIVVGENAGRHIADFSAQFQSEFVTLLSRRYVCFYFSDTVGFNRFFLSKDLERSVSRPTTYTRSTFKTSSIYI